jgi:hypothetical protein
MSWMLLKSGERNPALLTGLINGQEPVEKEEAKLKQQGNVKIVLELNSHFL